MKQASAAVIPPSPQREAKKVKGEGGGNQEALGVEPVEKPAEGASGSGGQKDEEQQKSKSKKKDPTAVQEAWGVKDSNAIPLHCFLYYMYILFGAYVNLTGRFPLSVPGFCEHRHPLKKNRRPC